MSSILHEEYHTRRNPQHVATIELLVYTFTLSKSKEFYRISTWCESLIIRITVLAVAGVSCLFDFFQKCLIDLLNINFDMQMERWKGTYRQFISNYHVGRGVQMNSCDFQSTISMQRYAQVGNVSKFVHML